MREKILSGILLFTVIGFVVTNAIILDKQIDEATEMVRILRIDENNVFDAKCEAEKLFEIFEQRESYISLTVSHDDLTNIENSFVELIGYLSVGDVDNAKVAKGRLTHSLEHLRRLSGINIHAII